MLQKTTYLLLLLVFVSCKKSGSEETDNIKLSRWLLGKWENNSAAGNLTESWEKVNDSTFAATSYFIKEKDTVHFETVALEDRGEKLSYRTTIIGQNGDRPTNFKLTSSTETQLVFENPKHDYPKKITYTQINENALMAEISGVLSGKASTEKYLMKKIK